MYILFSGLGGASKEETDSGLFVYSTIPIINIQIKDKNVSFDDNDNNGNHDNSNKNGNIGSNDSNDIGNENDNNENNNKNIKIKELSTDQIIFKESWNFKKNNFEWKNNENLISNPRIISQVSTDYMRTFLLRKMRKIT